MENSKYHLLSGIWVICLSAEATNEQRCTSGLRRAIQPEGEVPCFIQKMCTPQQATKSILHILVTNMKPLPMVDGKWLHQVASEPTIHTSSYK